MGSRERTALAVAALALVSGCATSAGTRIGGPPPRIPEGWVSERPELATLFPDGEPRAVSETWTRAPGEWRHCYEVEAPMREGERERFARAVERLGYRLAETTDEQPAFTAGDVSARQTLPSEGSAALFEALGDDITEGTVPTTSVRVCIRHAA